MFVVEQLLEMYVLPNQHFWSDFHAFITTSNIHRYTYTIYWTISNLGCVSRPARRKSVACVPPIFWNTQDTLAGNTSSLLQSFANKFAFSYYLVRLFKW